MVIVSGCATALFPLTSLVQWISKHLSEQHWKYAAFM